MVKLDLSNLTPGQRLALSRIWEQVAESGVSPAVRRLADVLGGVFLLDVTAVGVDLPVEDLAQAELTVLLRAVTKWRDGFAQAASPMAGPLADIAAGLAEARDRRRELARQAEAALGALRGITSEEARWNEPEED